MFQSLESRRMFSSSAIEPVLFEPVPSPTPDTAIAIRRTFLSRFDYTNDVPDIWTAPNEPAADPAASQEL
ncbi:hypothetical protein [Fontivita pretiosa]|uniref:hypothetical protein n=1 Tax=Fontivita pretiosa TaxID=2989684 RepID=UPI003D162DB3